MAQICEKCGKKIGMLSNESLELSDKRVLCFNCFKPIRNQLDHLLYINTKTEFDLLKNDILRKCHELYDDIVTNDIEKKLIQFMITLI